MTGMRCSSQLRGPTRSPRPSAGAARQYSGTTGGIALCQMAVTLTYATGRGHALTGRALYRPDACAAADEHREQAGVPEEVMFASKPPLAGAPLERAQSLGIRAAFVAGDEVHGGRQLRCSIRQRGTGYVMAVRANHTLITGSGRTVTAAAAASMIPAHAWHRMRTGSGTKGHPPLRLGDAGNDQRRYPRRRRRRAQRPADPAAPLHRHPVVLPVLDTRPGPADPADRHHGHPLANRKIISSPSRAPAWTPGRSSAGNPGTAGPRSACSPTSTSPSP
jgi:hypothetical protein